MNNQKQHTDVNLHRENNLAIRKEINSYKVSIDRSVFKKTAEEKLKLKQAKMEYKLSLKQN